jgi:hypothetical protein
MAEKTIVGAEEPYCSASYFVKYVDTNFIGQLVTDDGNALTAQQILDSYDSSESVIYEVLCEASAQVEMHALRGRRYTTEDLRALAESHLVGSRMLRGLVADVAVGLLRDRRVFNDDRDLPNVRRANETLKQLANGDVIFPFDENARAGLPKGAFIREADLNRTGMVSFQQRDYFGRRSRDDRPSW